MLRRLHFCLKSHKKIFKDDKDGYLSTWKIILIVWKGYEDGK